MYKFLMFMPIWVLGCAFVDIVVPNIANAYQMAIAWFFGTVGIELGKLVFGEK